MRRITVIAIIWSINWWSVAIEAGRIVRKTEVVACTTVTERCQRRAVEIKWKRIHSSELRRTPKFSPLVYYSDAVCFYLNSPNKISTNRVLA